ncbi:DUF4179 domain-containing protein [Paenibacillus sp. BT-177]|uniref:DUF4179 domain-containing protein n=1 Tax=Paenibacillus sp. BT-177 TaxID=2986930 RepID=UPI0021F7EDA9|nr:DUF4179 domain-containing protein [Paenibacillus sp. BT-177]
MNPSGVENQDQELDEKLQSEKENLEAEMVVIPDLVRQRLDAFYAQMESYPELLPNRPSSHLSVKRFFRGTAITAASAALIGVMIIGSAFVSPTMAESLKQVPLVDSVFKLAGDLGLQTADRKGLATSTNLSVTHDGITLKVSQIIFDGTRLVVALEKQDGGQKVLPLFTRITPDGNIPEDSIEKFDLFINGKSALNQNGAFSLLDGGPGKDSNSMIISYMRDPAGGLPDLPEQFDLKVYAKLKGVTKPFTLQTTVYKTKLGRKVFQPQISKTNQYLKYTVNRVEMTPVTTRILTTFTMLVDLKDMPDDYAVERKYISTEGPHKNYTKKEVKPLNYAVIDDQGRELEILGGSGQSISKNQPGQMVMLFTPFVDPPKKITFKPYILLMTPDGRAILDAKGQWVRQYLPEFEITIDVPQNTNHP